MATQLSRAERLARADDTLDNTGRRDAICPQVSALDLRYRACAASGIRRPIASPATNDGALRRDLRQNAASM
jgi:hypothetical protein